MNARVRLAGFALWACVLLSLAGGARAQAQTSSEKLWREPALQKRIDQNIEKYRKGEAAVEIVDAAGKPLPGLRITATQTGHEFLFGCNAFVLGQLKTPEMNRRYEEAFLKVCNFATVPFYWAGTEPARGELRYAEGCRDIWRRPPGERFVAFAARHGLTLKGHPLLWHAHNPSWLPKDADELRALYRKRFGELAERFGRHVPIWDVVNESLVCPKTYPLYTPDRGYVAWAFAQAVPLFPPGNVMMINEVTSFNFQPAGRNAYLAQVKTLLAGGAKVRGVGLQFHFFRRPHLDAYLKGPNCDPDKLLDLYEAFSELNLPLYITEITIPSSGEGGDELQARVVRDHYRLWFAAPAMAGITWWNLGDGTAVQGENEAKGGLLDEELKPKPAYAALDELINKEWKTTADLRSDPKGAASFRGFYGTYRLEASDGAKTQSFEIRHFRGQNKPHRLTFAP
ncbi:MAG: Endo-1,4-beta-xylanase Z precursor [Planctomycetes bacterium ADurb.Bin126]|nr:MAG: Endo-1,4-beta-xylanase Z precursor [Planctomycetes bacterium ADurb.Bin126]HOD79816.1 endo-1,4-beta-xylanase [Phycisphaerae bacterium]HQL72824.1 endo-1,4-beta-xylanase [Phycisphaerae bacterium]